MTPYLEEIYSLLKELDDEVTLFYFYMHADDNEDEEHPADCGDGSKRLSELLIRIRFDSEKAQKVLQRLMSIEARDDHAIVTDVVGLMRYLSHFR